MYADVRLYVPMTHFDVRYDLSKDLGQLNNIASSNPTTVAAMLAQMKTVRFPGGYCGEPMPTPPAPPPGPPLPLSYLKGTWDQGKVRTNELSNLDKRTAPHLQQLD